MVMAQKERKYTTTYKLWCLIKPAVTKRVWHEHSYVRTAASARRTRLFIVYLLFNLFIPHCTLHLSIQSVADWKFEPGKAWGSAKERGAGANCKINITQLVSQRNQSHFLHLQFQSFQMAVLLS